MSHHRIVPLLLRLGPTATFCSAILTKVCAQFALPRLPNDWSPELREAVVSAVLGYLPVFAHQCRPLGFLSAASSEKELVEAISRALDSLFKQPLWPSVPQTFRLYPHSANTSVVDLSNSLGHAPYTVNMTRATGMTHGGLAFGSTIAGPPGLRKEQVRLIRLQDSTTAFRPLSTLDYVHLRVVEPRLHEAMHGYPCVRRNVRRA
ncbi:hypothetical protein K438DRAFT_1771664 [Mycena galopus ATCC 62051]|nr:hypothetical protein K438DRAFT_1771664 [Mycena galopus ATCC 62051]